MKATKAEIQQRVEEILQIRLAGAEFWDIRQYAAEKGWQVSDRQLWRYIRQADQLLARVLEKDRDKLLNRHLAQRRALLAKAMSIADYRTALAVLKDEAELQGLYDHSQLPGPGGTAPELSPESRLAELARLLDAARTRAAGLPAPPASGQDRPVGG
jgi:hypothetical protein